MSIKQTQPKGVLRPKKFEGETVVKTATNWLFFWLVAGIAIAKDLADLALNLLSGALATTVVGLPVSVIVSILGALMTLTVATITVTYLIYTKQNVFLKIGITSVCALMGMLPIINLLPESTIGFFLSFFVGGIATISRKVVGRVASAGKDVVLNNS